MDAHIHITASACLLTPPRQHRRRHTLRCATRTHMTTTKMSTIATTLSTTQIQLRRPFVCATSVRCRTCTTFYANVVKPVLLWIICCVHRRRQTLKVSTMSWLSCCSACATIIHIVDSLCPIKCIQYIVGCALVCLHPDADKSYVEFFNPKIRRELEKKDEEYKKQHGTKGAAPGGDDWIWLTNYCRIPVGCFTCCVPRQHRNPTKPEPTKPPV